MVESGWNSTKLWACTPLRQRIQLKLRRIDGMWIGRTTRTHGEFKKRVEEMFRKATPDIRRLSPRLFCSSQRMKRFRELFQEGRLIQ